MENSPETKTASSFAALEIVTRPEFGPTDFFELLDKVRGNSREYESLASAAPYIDEYVGQFDVDDRVLRKAAVDVAIGYCKTAVRLLKDHDSRLSYLIRGRACQLLDEHTNAIPYYEAAQKLTSQPTTAERIFLAQCYVFNRRIDDARRIYESLAVGERDTYQARYLLGLLTELQGDPERAIEIYEQIIKDFHNSPDAKFRIAVILDQRGEDPGKVEEIYRSLISEDKFHEGAAVNLALIMIDDDRNEEAEALLNRILKFNPDNERVWMFLRDASSNTTVQVEEGRTKEDEKLRQILRLPISEFELSVRSRNCLARMNVHSLGDLISKSEAELLAYKNFGETSLKEIRDILNRKGLRLGMNREEVERKMRSPSQRLAALTVTDNILEQPLSALSLSVRSQKCLESMGIITVRELIEQSERELLSSKNFGLTSLTEVKKKLATFGLNLAPDEI
ncbi:MAG: DNA-directed RNA polymerase subunit alpha C-terminal domain-containing protein [Planctomycetota bacterium]